MILVTLGTQDKKFYRILNALEDSFAKGIINDEVVVQAGSSSDFKSNYMKIFESLPMNEFNELIKKCDIIITHGGVGSIVSGLNNNKKIIAIARKSIYGEAQNDHQEQIIEEFVKNGYILGAKHENELSKAIFKAKKFKPKTFKSNKGNFQKFIQSII